MRRLATLVLLLIAVSAGQASANAFQQLIPATPLMGGGNLFGVHLLVGGDRVEDIGVLGQVRFTSSPTLDWGLQLGFTDAGDGGVMIGGDIRPSLKRADSEFPLDLAFDGGAGITILDAGSILEFVPAIEASHRFPLSGGSQGALSPYMSLGMDINIVNPDEGDSDSDLDFVARFGVEWQATKKFGWQAEFGVGDLSSDFTTGVNVAF